MRLERYEGELKLFTLADVGKISEIESELDMDSTTNSDEEEFRVESYPELVEF